MRVLDWFRKRKERGYREGWAYWMKKTVQSQGGEASDLQISAALDIVKFYECPGCGEKTLYIGKSNQPPLCPDCGRLTVPSAPPSDEALSLTERLQRSKSMVGFARQANSLKAATESYDKANRLCDEGKYEDAIEWFDKAIAAYADGPDFWYNKSVALLKLGRADQALACSSKAVQLNPRDADYWLYQGMSLAFLARFEEAITCYDKALELNPMLAHAVGNRFVALARLHGEAEASRYLVEALTKGGDQLTREVMELIEKATGLKLRIDDK